MNKILCERFFYTLADRNRLDIISLLLSGPKTVTQIHQELDIQQSLASHHLKLLRDCGFVHFEARGKSKLYSLNRTTIVPILRILETHAQSHCGLACSCKASAWPEMGAQQALDHESAVVMEKVAILERYVKSPHKASDRELKGLVDFFKNDMEQHFLMEEKSVFPALRKSDLDSELIDTLEMEHMLMRRKFAELERLAQASDDGQGISRIASDLAGLFRAHLQKEEGIVLPYMKSLASGHKAAGTASKQRRGEA